MSLFDCAIAVQVFPGAISDSWFHVLAPHLDCHDSWARWGGTPSSPIPLSLSKGRAMDNRQSAIGKPWARCYSPKKLLWHERACHRFDLVC